MKTKHYFMLAAALVALPVAAKNIDANQAAQKALQFMNSHAGLRASQTLELVYTGQTESQLRAGVAPSYYVYNVKGGTGFVIISGDDVARPILGYSFNSSFSSEVPASVKAFLDHYDQQIRWAQSVGLQSLGQDVMPTATGGGQSTEDSQLGSRLSLQSGDPHSVHSER